MNKADLDHFLDRFPRAKKPSGILTQMVRTFRNPYIAALLSATSIAAVAVGAYPESRSAKQKTVLWRTILWGPRRNVGGYG